METALPEDSVSVGASSGDTAPVSDQAQSSRRLFRQKPVAPPKVPLYGLGTAWSGRRERNGTWNMEGQWLSYHLVHFRGHYWDASKQRLVVSHELKGAAGLGEVRSTENAALQAMATYFSDNNPLNLPDPERRAWIREELGKAARADGLDEGWQPHQIHVDRVEVPALIRRMPHGYCMVTETEHAYLAISARRYTPALRLTRQSDVLRTYARE